MGFRNEIEMHIQSLYLSNYYNLDLIIQSCILKLNYEFLILLYFSLKVLMSMHFLIPHHSMICFGIMCIYIVSLFLLMKANSKHKLPPPLPDNPLKNADVNGLGKVKFC